MNFIHEVEYVFEYNNLEYRENYYRDTLEGRRYLKVRDGYTPLNLKSTGNQFEEIKPTLLSSTVLNDTETLLVYEATDINKIIILYFIEFPDGGIMWGYKNGIYFYDKIQ